MTEVWVIEYWDDDANQFIPMEIFLDPQKAADRVNELNKENAEYEYREFQIEKWKLSDG